MNMVLENNVIRLKEIQQRITEDHDAFQNIESVNLTTIDRVLKRHRIKMKQVTKVPYERNSERVKEMRFRYVQVSSPVQRAVCLGTIHGAHNLLLYFHVLFFFFYIQTILEVDADENANEYIYIDEAGFNLNTRRRRGRNVIGQRATVDVPGLRGGNNDVCCHF